MSCEVCEKVENLHLLSEFNLIYKSNNWDFFLNAAQLLFFVKFEVCAVDYVCPYQTITFVKKLVMGVKVSFSLTKISRLIY